LRLLLGIVVVALGTGPQVEEDGGKRATAGNLQVEALPLCTGERRVVAILGAASEFKLPALLWCMGRRVAVQAGLSRERAPRR
jgi:hypothetical protein